MSTEYKTKGYWDGENLKIQEKTKLIEWLKHYPEDKWFEVRVSPLGDLNASAQRNLYFKWCDILAEEYGWDSGKNMHQYLKDTYNNGESTKGFTVLDWTLYMNKVIAFASSNNITLPTGSS